MVAYRTSGQGHIRGWGRTTSLRRYEKDGSQRDHQEPGGNSSPQTNVKDHVRFQPTGVCFFIAGAAAFYGSGFGTLWHFFFHLCPVLNKDVCIPHGF